MPSPPTGRRTVASLLLRASHPEPTIAVTGLATLLAVLADRTRTGVAVVAVAVLAGQLSIGWSNDLLDERRDAASGRTDKPVAAGRLARPTVGVACALALGLCLPFSFANGFAAGWAHLVTVGGGWAYNLGLKSTPLSFVPYVLAFGALPAFVTLGLPGQPLPAGWVVAVGALLGLGAHLLNVVPDIADDLATGVRGLPQLLGPVASRAGGALLLAGAGALVTFGPAGDPPSWAYAGLAGVVAVATMAALLGRQPPPGSPTGARPTGVRSRAPFLAALLVAGLDLLLLAGRGASLV